MSSHKDWLFSSANCSCGLRAAGVLVKNNKLLVQREKGGREYALPGGHVQIGETLAEALVREYKEETGAAVAVEELLWSEESFWEHQGKKFHTITFYFRIKEAEGFLFPETAAFLPHNDNENVVWGWLDVAELPNVVLYPAFVKTELHCLHGPRKHFVWKE